MEWLVAFLIKRGWPTWLAPMIFIVIGALLVWGIYIYIHHLGVMDERSRWEKKETQALIKKQEKILQLNTQYRELERQSQIDKQRLKEHYEKELQDAKAKETSLIDAVRNSDKRLSIAIKSTSKNQCESGSGGVGAIVGGGENETRAELSGQASEFLIRLAAEADEVVIESNVVKDELLACRAQYAKVKKLCEAQ